MSKHEFLSQSQKVMRAAWQIARAAARRHGGKVSEYVRQAVSLAWRAVRASARDAAEALVRALRAAGLPAKVWAGGDWREVRVYVAHRDGHVGVGADQAWSSLRSRTAGPIIERWAVAYGREVTR